MKAFFGILALMAVIYFAFITMTDRICDKQFSESYKQTAEYKAMKCE